MNIKEQVTDLLSQKDYIPLTPQEIYALLCVSDPSLDEGEFWRCVQEMASEDFSVAFTKRNKLVLAETVGQFKGVFSASSKRIFFGRQLFWILNDETFLFSAKFIFSKT